MKASNVFKQIFFIRLHEYIYSEHGECLSYIYLYIQKVANSNPR